MKRFQFSIKWLFALQAAVLLLLSIACSLRIIQFHYPRAVDNDPLLSPVVVESVSGNTIVLQDGRTLHVEAYDEPLDQIIQESEFRVDVESAGDDSNLVIFAKRRGWICGTPWTGLIEIPLIADDVPINSREPIGTAKIVSR
jgi:hypothetical protein